MEWKYQSDGSFAAPGHERFVALHPARGGSGSGGDRDSRYVISRPAAAAAGQGKQEAGGFVALFEAMHACSDGAACFDFRQEVCPVPFATLAMAQEACRHHASCGN